MVMESNDTGKTPTDKNIVFTYKVLADKVDENGNALKGAKFELFKQNEALSDLEIIRRTGRNWYR